MKQNEKILKEYTINVGETSYVFHDIELDQSPSGKWVLTYKIMRGMMKAIAALILSDLEKELTFEELDHLVKTAEISFSDIASKIRKSRSTISKWKESKNVIPFTDSVTIKLKVMSMLFPEIENRMRDPQKTSDYLFKNANLPRPSVAA